MSKINKDALFSDETSQYRIPMEVNPGDNVTVIFRTAKDNVDGVYLISKGNRLPMKKFATNPLALLSYRETADSKSQAGLPPAPLPDIP
mgnify:CR=1 FL=1